RRRLRGRQPHDHALRMVEATRAPDMQGRSRPASSTVCACPCPWPGAWTSSWRRHWQAAAALAGRAVLLDEAAPVNVDRRLTRLEPAARRRLAAQLGQELGRGGTAGEPDANLDALEHAVRDSRLESASGH